MDVGIASTSVPRSPACGLSVNGLSVNAISIDDGPDYLIVGHPITLGASKTWATDAYGIHCCDP
jgi:hypothetical protein